MNGIYIPGMEMPREGYRQVFITADGEAFFFPSTPQNGELRFKVIRVPDHGRLKDYDRIMKEYNEWFNQAESREYESMFYALYRALSDSRTIIPSR